MGKTSNLVKRAYFYKKNNAPFLSGDVFADNADVQVYPPKFRTRLPSKREVSDANIIFCPSGMASQFFDEYRSSINAKILIFGNGDEEFESFDFKIPRAVRRIYLQNLMFSDPKFHLLPIGLENIRLIRNGMPKNYSRTSHEKVDRMLVGPFSQTHQDRMIFQENTYDQKLIHCQQDFLAPREYVKLCSKYRFVAAPRGNGIDTHRFWETLYLGNVPVIESSSWSEHLQKLDINYLLTEGWSNESLSDAVDKWKSTSDSRRKNSDLWFASWERKFRQDL